MGGLSGIIKVMVSLRQWGRWLWILVTATTLVVADTPRLVCACPVAETAPQSPTSCICCPQASPPVSSANSGRTVCAQGRVRCCCCRPSSNPPSPLPGKPRPGEKTAPSGSKPRLSGQATVQTPACVRIVVRVAAFTPPVFSGLPLPLDLTTGPVAFCLSFWQGSSEHFAVAGYSSPLPSEDILSLCHRLLI